MGGKRTFTAWWDLAFLLAAEDEMHDFPSDVKLTVLLVVSALSGCAATSQTFEHYGWRVETTYKSNWQSDNVHVLTLCDKTAVVGDEGRCPALVEPVVRTSPGWAALTFQALAGMATYVPAALILRDGLRTQATSQTQVQQAQSAAQQANPLIQPAGTTVNIRAAGPPYVPHGGH